MEKADIRNKIACKAGSYYRKQLDGENPGPQPDVEEGKQLDKKEIPILSMEYSELLASVK